MLQIVSSSSWLVILYWLMITFHFYQDQIQGLTGSSHQLHTTHYVNTVLSLTFSDHSKCFTVLEKMFLTSKFWTIEVKLCVREWSYLNGWQPKWGYDSGCVTKGYRRSCEPASRPWKWTSYCDCRRNVCNGVRARDNISFLQWPTTLGLVRPHLLLSNYSSANSIRTKPSINLR